MKLAYYTVYMILEKNIMFTEVHLGPRRLCKFSLFVSDYGKIYWVIYSIMNIY